MNLRETLNKNPKVTAVLTGVVVVAALGVVVLQLTGGRGEAGTVGRRPTKAFFTTDGGATYFVDSADRLAPFQHDGKTAVFATVRQCNGKPFAQVLARYSSTTMKAMEQLLATKPEGWETEVNRLEQEGVEYAKPGTDRWVRANSPELPTVMSFRCPDGSMAEPVDP